MANVAVHYSAVLVSALISISSVQAGDSLEEAADLAEVFVYGQQSKNEAVLREITDPDQYEAMQKIRAEDKGSSNENVRVDDVEFTEIDGDRATARATYSRIHGKEKKQTEVHLQRIGGEWRVTTPAPTESE